MRILLTGADGFLGTSAAEALRATGADLVRVSRRTAGGAPAADTVTADLADPAAVMTLLRGARPQCIVNLAARVDFGVSDADLFEVNVLCPAILAGYCRRQGAHLVQASSVSVLGPHTRFGPDTPARPDTAYGRSKLLAEEVIAGSACDAAVIRFPGIFGGGGPEHLGVNRAMRQAAAGVRPTMTGSGAARRNYVYVKDAAAMIATVISGRMTGVFHAGGETTSIREMLQAVCDAWLPGSAPACAAGPDAADQLVEISPELATYRPFRDAVRDCR